MGLLLAVMLVGLCSAPAALATEGDAPDATLEVQSGKDLGDCSIKFTDSLHICADDAWWQMYYVQGKNVGVTPQFSLYLDGKLVPASKYTVTYVSTWWEGDDKKSKTVSPPLSPSMGDPASDGGSASFNIIVKPKSGSGYTGEYNQAEVVVVDEYNFGHYMAVYFSNMSGTQQYNINPMNSNYYVISKTYAQKVLNSLTAKRGCTPTDGGMNHDGTTVEKKYYTVTYYEAKKTAVRDNCSPAWTAAGKKLSGMPTAAGSYVMVIKGKSPYYGTASILFDIRDNIANVNIAAVKNQVYTGSPITPALTVTYNGKTLKQGVDYKVTWKNNKIVGTATATIEDAYPIETNYRGRIEQPGGTRFFYGKKSVTFKIVPKATYVKDPVKPISGGFTASWAKQTTQTSGYLLQYSTDPNFKTNVYTANIKSNATTSHTVKQKAGKWYVRVCAYKTYNDGKTRYESNWSQAKTVTIAKTQVTGK